MARPQEVRENYHHTKWYTDARLAYPARDHDINVFKTKSVLASRQRYMEEVLLPLPEVRPHLLDLFESG